MRLAGTLPVRMGAVFLLVYALLNWCYFLLPDVQLKRVHEVLILQPCATVLNSVLDVSVGAVAPAHHSEIDAVRHEAVACFPSNTAAKLAGLLSGLALVHGLNVARIVILYLIFKDYRNSFSDLHNLYMPTAMLLICGIAFLLWMSIIRQSGVKTE